MRNLHSRRRTFRQRGQALVEMTIIVPILMLMLGGVVEATFLLTADLSLETASREGARVAAAMGNNGTQGVCPNAAAEAAVDPLVLQTIQNSLTNSGVNLSGLQVVIYLANAAGNSDGTNQNVYNWNGTSFTTASYAWKACGRHDGTFGGGVYDQVGVKLSLTYQSRTGLLAPIFGSGLPMTAAAVYPIGPPWTLN